MQQTEISQHPRLTVIALAFLISSFFFFSLFFLLIKPAHAEESKLQLPTQGHLPVPTASSSAKPKWRPNTLLIMPHALPTDETSDDFKNTLKQLNGHVIKTIGEGELLTWVVQFDTAQDFVKAERQLVSDKHVTSMQRDFLFDTKAVVNDPYFPSQWHMGALNVVPAWNISQGSQNILGIVDSGCNGSVTDLSGKTYSGYNAINNVNGQSDVQGHGTMVATTAAANTNNGAATAGPARLSRIFPLRVGYSDGSVSASAILNAIYYAGNNNIKMLNISSNANPPYSFSSKTYNGTLHTYFKWYHDTKGGLIFNSAGNSGTQDSNPIVPYLIVVSAIDTTYYLASFSTYGNSVWFTAPGTNIYCSTKSNQVASVAGTSFSSPLVASIAALIWGAKPSLRNTDVENILRNTCYKSGGQSWTKWYGYGMPNAEAAMKAAKGL